MSSTDAGDQVLRRDEGPCRWLILNRPDRLNAVDEGMAAALRETLEQAFSDPACRVLVLIGAGRAFSAGQDLGERRNVATAPIDLGDKLAQNWHPLVRLIREAEKPVIAAVNGLASGAAANLALACDIVLAGRSARFAQPFVRLGIMPDCGGIATLPRLVGDARARALALTGEPISAEAAERFGLIWRAVADEALEDEVRAVVAALLRSAPLALAATKRALREASGRSFEEALAIEKEAQARLGFSRDYAEGIAAFFEKRDPRFEGR